MIDVPCDDLQLSLRSGLREAEHQSVNLIIHISTDIMYLQSRVYAKSTKLFESQMISVRNQEFGVYSAEQALTQLRSAVGGGGAA